VLLGGIVLTLAGAGHLVVAASGRRPAGMVGAAAGAMLAGILLMLLTRDTVRATTLGLAGFQPVTWVAPQWGPITIFAVLLVGTVATVWWMVSALVRAR